MNNDYNGDFKASILFPNAPLQSFGSGVITIRVLWEVVDPEGLEPSTKGFTLPRTRCHCVGKPKNPNTFPMAPFCGDRNRACAEPGFG